MEKLAELLLKIYPLENVPFKRRFILHAIFWLLFLVSLLFGVGYPNDPFIMTVIGAISFTHLCIVFFYVIAYLIPAIYSKYKGVQSIILIFITLLCMYLYFALETYIRSLIVLNFDLVKNKSSQYYALYLEVYKGGYWSYFKPKYLASDTFQLIFISLPAFFFKFIRIYTKVFSERKQLEIDFLRVQINPHFLVNTLNNIYSMVELNDHRSSETIISLSNLLNYVLYESAQPKVPLEKEINFIKEYIALEKLRNTQEVDVKLSINGPLVGNIAPHILITFIENAFKHGIGRSIQRCFIHININVENEKIFMEVTNSKAIKSESNLKKPLGGVGLENVKKRLGTLYGQKHTLEIKTEADMYKTILMVELDK